MKILALQHVPFEGPAAIEIWAKQRQHSITSILMNAQKQLPPYESFDLILILGGPMGVYQDDLYPWLIQEKQFLADALNGGSRLLGICLGAQLLSAVAGGRVIKNTHREIGFFKTWLTEDGHQSSIANIFPKPFTPLHWHADTFSIPPNGRHLFASEACRNQGFELSNGRMIGLQFHLETTPSSLQKLFFNCADEITEDKYIQSSGMMKLQTNRLASNQELLFRILDKMLEIPEGGKNGN